MWLALEIAVIGMGSVFTLLLLLMFLITVLAKLTAYFTPKEEKGVENNTLSDEQLKYIIHTAIKKYRIDHTH